MAGNYKQNKESQYQQGQYQKSSNQENQEAVEFHSSMPEVTDEDVEFIPDEHLEEEIEENQS